jgi:hypothetical protein
MTISAIPATDADEAVAMEWSGASFHVRSHDRNGLLRWDCGEYGFTLMPRRQARMVYLEGRMVFSSFFFERVCSPQMTEFWLIRFLAQ